MNESRLDHPRGFDGRFFVILSWAVRAVRLEGAAVLGLLDYFDQAGIRRVSRKRLLAELDGIAGKGLVDSALGRLLGLGWVKKIQVGLIGEDNRTVAHEFQLCPDEINKYLGNPLGYLASRNRNVPIEEVIHKHVPISDPISERPIIKNKDKELEKQQQPASVSVGDAQDPVVVFWGAAGGNVSILEGARGFLAEDIAGACEEQARWAGLAWANEMEHGNVGHPVGLARRLARLAATDKISAPASVTQEKKDEARAAAAADGEVAHQAALQAAAAAVMREIQASQVPRGNLLDIIKPRFPAP